MSAEIQKLYIAYFNRPADPGGLTFWTKQLAAGTSMAQIANSFSASAEYQAIYNASTNFELVVKLYQNLFGRTPLAGEASWWSDQITPNGAVTITTIANQLASGTTAGSADNIAVLRKIDAGLAYTASIATTEQIIAYKGTAAFAKASQWLAPVKDAATLATAIAPATLNAAVADAVASGGASGQTFTLTTGVDTSGILVGSGGTTSTAGNDTFNGNVANAFSVSDAIDGGLGTNTLTVVQAGAALTLPLNATVKNIQTGNFITDTTALSLNSTSFTGMTALNVTGITAMAATAAATTAVTMTRTTATGAATVNGGSSVTVTETGSSGGTLAIGGTTNAAGAVAVTSTVLATNGSTGNAITVTGGTTINVTQRGSNAAVTGENTTAGAITATGGATTTAITVTQGAARTGFTAAGDQAGVSGFTNGAVTIADKNAAETALAGTLTTVTLDSFGAATINSGALTSLTLRGTGTSAAVTMGALTTPTVTALALNFNGATIGGTVTTPTVTTLNIGSTGTASTVAALTAAQATTINVSGDAKVTFTNNTLAAVTAIVSTNTAGVTFGTTALGAGVAFTGGAGADTILNTVTGTKLIDLGAGDDTLTYAGTVGTGGSILGGLGNDTIIMTTTLAAAADDNSAFNSKVSGFEILQISNATAATLDLDGINAVSTVILDGDAAGATLNNLASGGTVRLKVDETGTLTVGVKSALVGAADVLNLHLNKSTLLVGGIVVAANVETVNINVADATAGGSTAVIHTLTLQATSATSVVVTGNNGLNLTNANNTAITNFDASGVVGNTTTLKVDAFGAQTAATTDAATALVVTFASANTTASAAVTIKGGAGNDVLTGNASIDTITGGLGADTITGGAGADVIILTEATAAIDKVVFSGGATTAQLQLAANGLDRISGFGSTDTFNVAALGDGTTGAGITAITAAAAAGAFTDDRAVVISTNGTAANLTTGGTATVTDFTSTSQVAAYLSERFTSALTTGGVFVINDTTTSANNSYVYTFVDIGTTAGSVTATELALVGIISNGGTALTAANIVYA